MATWSTVGPAVVDRTDRTWRWLWLVSVMGMALVVMLPPATGVILCECTTEECLSEGKRTCYAAHYCYSQYLKDTLSRGCIDKGSPLLCENRKPKGIDNWPFLFCCNDRDYCNKDVTPTMPLNTPHEKKVRTDSSSSRPPPEARGEPHPVIPDDPPPVRCQNGGAIGSQADTPQDGGGSSSSSSSKVINPIYIAVPVAGVCVLLALVIFAMYLLRRRNPHHHHFDNYHHYHDHLPPAPPHAHAKQGPGGGGPGAGGGGGGGSGGGGGGGGGGMPLYHHHHHCDCVCQKSLPPCGGKVNRCTDSERSSSGSETKLFLQA